MKVGYSRLVRLFSGFLVVIGVLVLASVLKKDISFSDLIAPVVWVVMGVSFLTRTYFVVDDHTLVVNAVIWPFQKRYTFSSLKALKLEDKKVWLIEGNQTKRIRRIAYWLVGQKDWQNFRAFVEQRQSLVNTT